MRPEESIAQSLETVCGNGAGGKGICWKLPKMKPSVSLAISFRNWRSHQSSLKQISVRKLLLTFLQMTVKWNLIFAGLEHSRTSAKIVEAKLPNNMGETLYCKQLSLMEERPCSLGELFFVELDREEICHDFYSHSQFCYFFFQTRNWSQRLFLVPWLRVTDKVH